MPSPYKQYVYSLQPKNWSSKFDFIMIFYCHHHCEEQSLDILGLMFELSTVMDINIRHLKSDLLARSVHNEEGLC